MQLSLDKFERVCTREEDNDNGKLWKRCKWHCLVGISLQKACRTYLWDAYYCMLFSSTVKVWIRFSVWLFSGNTHARICTTIRCRCHFPPHVRGGTRRRDDVRTLAARRHRWTGSSVARTIPTAKWWSSNCSLDDATPRSPAAADQSHRHAAEARAPCLAIRKPFAHNTFDISRHLCVL